jgi:hypothetical protein
MKNKKLSIQSLRASGAKVRVIHERKLIPDPSQVNKLLAELQPTIKHVKKGEFSDLGNISLPIFAVDLVVSPRGGRTICEIDTKDGRYYRGESYTNDLDSYNKKAGINICLERIRNQAAENGHNLI